MTVDTARGLVFIPIGQPTDQNFGSSRPGSNLYSSSVVALDAATGALKWYYQMTHHDIFDWDANAPPTLIEVKRNGKKIPAIADYLSRVAFAVNQTYVDRSTILHDGDELAVIPPVSGG